MEEPMDNPRISGSRSFFGLDLAKVERSFYEQIQVPDLIMVLQADLAELRKRKTDIELPKHEAKADAINNLVAGGNLVTVDANQPYEKVLLDVKKAIWQVI